jgi:hypothetical protein
MDPLFVWVMLIVPPAIVIVAGRITDFFLD